MFAGNKFVVCREDLANEYNADEFADNVLEILLDNPTYYGKVNVLNLQSYLIWNNIVDNTVKII